MMPLSPLAWKDKPSLIETLLPAQKISAEAQKERKAGAGQTLTALGSYWKGRKPLILNKACILGALLPATGDAEADLEIFELLMAIDDQSFERRLKSPKDAAKLPNLSYLEKLTLCKRPEECDDRLLYGPIWERVNQHLGTTAHSFPDLIEQLGILRFGHRPRVGDTFCGSGQIPFEAARLGCDVYASDLNPIACMLTWGALNIVGGLPDNRTELKAAEKNVICKVQAEIESMGIESDDKGWYIKGLLYCIEAKCPESGWVVPLIPSLVISEDYQMLAELIPVPHERRYEIIVRKATNSEELTNARKGTVRTDGRGQDPYLFHSVNSIEYRTKISTLRGDYRLLNGTIGNKLRRWEKSDFKPHKEDIFQERLYAVLWAHPKRNGRGEYCELRSVTMEDLEREKVVEDTIRKNLTTWQEQGLVPDMPIEPGEETTRLVRERGWTYWHHLFNPRQLLMAAIVRKYLTANLSLGFSQLLNWNSRLSQWNGAKTRGYGNSAQTFYNQALNTFYNYACRGFSGCFNILMSNDLELFSLPPILTGLECKEASRTNFICDLFITDPPYADAVHYHEITEFFIAWLRKNPPPEFAEWVWDSRRALAIKGSGDEFRREMIAAYAAMANQMPDQGLQIVMFTHQDAAVWVDMASIMWGAGLQVTAAWYIATETTSELKKGGYVQGTVLLVLRKRLREESAYRDELVEEVRLEVAQQIETMVGLNQTTGGKGRAENLFEDADLQMAGYAAALRVLTGYRWIDGQDMAAEALRPRQKGDRDGVREIIDYAVQVANEHLVPEFVEFKTLQLQKSWEKIWGDISGSERYYLKMLEMEALGLKKLDNYQNFAKAFRVTDYSSLMASMKANNARLKNALDFKKTNFEGDFGRSSLRSVLFALYELQRDLDSDEVMTHLRELVPGYYNHREDLMAFCQFIANKREHLCPEEAAAARVLLTRIKHERLG